MRLLTQELDLARIDAEPLASFDCDTWEDISAARARIREHGNVLDEWITAVKDELGIELDVDTGVLLDLARDAAHGVARPAAPLTTFLVGYAAAQAGSGGPAAVAEAARKAAALAARWAEEAEQATPEAGAATGPSLRAGQGRRARRAGPGRRRMNGRDQEAESRRRRGSPRTASAGQTRQEPAPGSAPGSDAAPGTDPGRPATPPRCGTARPPGPTPGRSPRASGAPPRPVPARVPLDQALGQVLAEPLTALCDLPSFDTSAMDGWAVAGPGPWTVQERRLDPRRARRGPAAPRRRGGTDRHRRPYPARGHRGDPQRARPHRRGRAASCTPSARWSPARTSGRGARSAAPATNSCPPAPW